MKHTGWHTKHFLGGWETLKTQPVLLLIAPIASIIGLGALIDTVLYALSFVLSSNNIAPVLSATANQVLPPNVIGPTLVQLFSNASVLILALAVLFVSILCQAAVVHVTHRHSKRRKHLGLKAAFNKALLQWPRLFLIHLASFATVFLLVLDMHYGAKIFQNWGADWAIWPVLVIDGLLILYVLTVKMLAVQFVAGDDRSFTEAVQDAWRITWRSPGMVLEHNLFLFAINAIAMVILVAIVNLLSYATAAVGTWAMVLFDNRVVGGVLEIGLFVLGALFISGLLTAYNMASWSMFTKSMERRRMHSSIKHLAKRYSPFR